MIFRYLRLGLAVAMTLAAVPSCGIISSDVASFDLALPDKKFSINANSWQVNQTDADLVLSTSCATQPALCSAAAETACATGCRGTCNAAKTCDLSLDISLAQLVNIATEKPDLASFTNQSVIKVSVDSVTYEITKNGLNVEIPELTVYVAPMSVISASEATAIGTIDPIPAGWTTTEAQSIKFTATGRDKLVDVMSTYKTPFNVIVGSSILVTSGQQVPTGQLDAVVHITGHAGL